MESGKTTALQGTLLKTRQSNEEKSLIICTEEGETEYQTDALKYIGVDVVYVDEEEMLTEEFLEDLNRNYKPVNVYLEFNGMWDLKAFLNKKLPKGWYIANAFSLVDATTYEVYMKNMRQTLMTPLSVSDVILFNRCKEGFRKGEARRAIKLLNNRAELFFAGEDGKVDQGFDELNLTETEGVLEIDDAIFCPWFVDLIEHTDKYYGKEVELTAMVSSGKGLMKDQFYAGRYVAICCAEDAQFVGFVAKYQGNTPKDASWIKIRATLKQGELEGKQRVIVLDVSRLEVVAAPEEKLLYFG